MGTDINSIIQIKYRGRWHTVSKGYEYRSYFLFGILANVRNGYCGAELPPISGLRGQPKDMLDYSKHCDLWIQNYNKTFSPVSPMEGSWASWLTFNEIEHYDWEREATIDILVSNQHFSEWKKSREKLPRSYCPTESNLHLVASFVRCEIKISIRDLVCEFFEWFERWKNSLEEYSIDLKDCRLVFDFD